MRYIILFIVTLLAGVAAYVLTCMGVDHMDPNIGQGLHPVIAFTLAVLVINLAAVAWFYVFSIADEPESIQDELDDLMVKHY